MTDTLVIPAQIVATPLAALGWGPKIFMLAALWWGILFNLPKLIAALTGGETGGSGLGLMRFYFGYRAIKDISRDGLRAATFVPRKAKGAIDRRTGSRAEAEEDMARERAEAELSRGAHEAAEDEQRNATGVLQDDQSRRDNISTTQQQLDRTESEMERLGSQLATQDLHPDQQRAIEDRIERLGEDAQRLRAEVDRDRQQLASPAELQDARSVIGRYGTGEITLSKQDLERYMDRRVADADAGVGDADRDAMLVGRVRQKGALHKWERADARNYAVNTEGESSRQYEAERRERGRRHRKQDDRNRQRRTPRKGMFR